jgi:hypothetical protein
MKQTTISPGLRDRLEVLIDRWEKKAAKHEARIDAHRGDPAAQNLHRATARACRYCADELREALNASWSIHPNRLDRKCSGAHPTS